jgi:glyceraldehyde 3-phosphate dehydrogenase
MAVKLAINGFGRIGRQTLRALIEKIRIKELRQDDIEVVAVNDLADPKTLAHLLKYDSVYGILEGNVSWSDEGEGGKIVGSISVDGRSIKVINEPDPLKLPWKKLAVDVVIESTGRFTDKVSAGSHLKAGAKKVIISAPAKGGGVPTYIMGVNMEKAQPSENIISNASCTTNCIAPVMAVMEKHFKVLRSLMTTIHAYTADQSLVDGPHRDLRRGRSAAINTVPTTTGAAQAAAETVPELKGHFDGLSVRVPVPVGSLSDITLVTEREATVDEINNIFIKECENPKWRGILTYTQEPLVSSDIIGNPHSTIVDLSLTQVVDKTLVKIIAWYDNEWGYSNRLVEQVLYLESLINKR